MDINFGANLKFQREQKGWTQSDLAGKINKTTQTVYKYEKGELFPSRDILIKLLNIFNVTPNELLLDSETVSTIANQIQKEISILSDNEFKVKNRVNEIMNNPEEYEENVYGENEELIKTIYHVPYLEAKNYVINSMELSELDLKDLIRIFEYVIIMKKEKLMKKINEIEN